MSIYHPRNKPLPGSRQPQAPSSSRRIELVPAADPVRLPPAENKAWQRKARPAEYLLPATNRWFESLPPAVRPTALATRHARIVNLIAQQWNDYDACWAYFDELLAGRRAGRQGFPANMRREIWTLREHFRREHFREMRRMTGSELAIV